MATDLLDVNVWVALADRDHPHHAQVKKYWHSDSGVQFAFCRLSMLGFLRIITNSVVMGGHPFSANEAWNAFHVFRQMHEVCYLEEPNGFEYTLREFTDRQSFPNRLWSDAYMAAFASKSDLRLVSLDRDFQAFQGLNWILLN